MACCNKTRKEKVRQVMKRRLFEADKQSTVSKLSTQNPKTIDKKLLSDYHRKTHMLYQGALRYKPPNKGFINRVVSIHDTYVKEMLHRGMKHSTPLQRL
jgi:hypothetical protein